MTDQEKIIENMARVDVRDAFEAWALADCRDLTPLEFEERTPTNYCYYETDSVNEAYIGWCAAFAICAPAVRERCAAHLDKWLRPNGYDSEAARSIIAEVRALPLDGLTGGKGESEGKRWTDPETGIDYIIKSDAPAAPAPVQAGMGWDRMSGIMRCLVTGNPVLTDTHPVGHPCQCKNCRTALAAPPAKGESQ